ncbi:MAG: hypothetical protein MI754_06010, partial [Chromatiales bacterium]|nr:hypothetical protein [Chromatiales bacterium]
MDAGVIGGILGTVLGVGGGAIGTYVSIKNTQSPEERAFMIRASIIAWLAITLFLILLLVLPHPYHLLMWIPYG